MFLGEHQHSLDAKGRVILPARFRDQLVGGAVMARALDGCLAVFPSDEFARVAERLRQARARGPVERQAARSFFSGAVEITPDRQGRVAVPQHLRDYAALTRDVTVAGNYDHIEIWDTQRYQERNQQGSASIVGGEGIDDFA